MSKNNSNIFVPSAYSVWTGPFGTALPTTLTASPNGMYEVGILSDQGIGESRNLNETKIYDMLGQLQRIIRNQEERPFTFQALEDNRVVRELRYPNSVLTTQAGTAEVETATINGTPTGGTFTLTGGIGGSGTTSAIAYNAAGSAVQTALRALPGLSTVTVAGSAGGPYTITFPAAYGDVIQLTTDYSGLTGGTSPNVAILTSTPGVASVNTRVVGSGTGSARRAWVIYVADGSKANMFTFSNAEATQTGTVATSTSGGKIFEFALQPYPDPVTGAFFTLIDNDGAQSATYA